MMEYKDARKIAWDLLRSWAKHPRPEAEKAEQIIQALLNAVDEIPKLKLKLRKILNPRQQEKFQILNDLENQIEELQQVIASNSETYDAAIADLKAKISAKNARIEELKDALIAAGVPVP